jgi:hypothetical protein
MAEQCSYLTCLMAVIDMKPVGGGVFLTKLTDGAPTALLSKHPVPVLVRQAVLPLKMPTSACLSPMWGEFVPGLVPRLQTSRTA